MLSFSLSVWGSSSDILNIHILENELFSCWISSFPQKNKWVVKAVLHYHTYNTLVSVTKDSSLSVYEDIYTHHDDDTFTTVATFYCTILTFFSESEFITRNFNIFSHNSENIICNSDFYLIITRLYLTNLTFFTTVYISQWHFLPILSLYLTTF